MTAKAITLHELSVIDIALWVSSEGAAETVRKSAYSTLNGNPTYYNQVVICLSERKGTVAKDVLHRFEEAHQAAITQRDVIRMNARAKHGPERAAVDLAAADVIVANFLSNCKIDAIQRSEKAKRVKSAAEKEKLTKIELESARQSRDAQILININGLETRLDVARMVVKKAIELIKINPEFFEEEISSLKDVINNLAVLAQGKSLLWVSDLRQSVAAIAKSDTSCKIEPAVIAESISGAQSNMVELKARLRVAMYLASFSEIEINKLRIFLLPLDLLPGAVINDLNECALDLTGEPALEEDGDNVIVRPDVLSQVIAAWS